VSGVLRALVASCHPGPCVAVTVFTTVLAAVAGAPTSTCLLVAAAVLTGQLSIGWSNDVLDARRDAAVGRRDKPVARAAVSARTVRVAIGAAVVLTLILSLRLGWRAGLLHLGAVGCGWAYNLGLKATVASWLPYALAFGSLPAIATLALPEPRLAGWWALTAAAALGVAAHLANVLPDLEDDRRTGVRGLPHRLGATGSLAVAAALLLIATVVITVGSPDGRRPLDWVALGLLGAAILAVPIRIARAASKTAFFSIMALAALDLALIATTSGHLH
jgi:4-hydroxybenzoate polyprenyltransferase